MFDPENLWWQMLFVLGVGIADAYSDGIMARRFIFPRHILTWTPWQWAWHVAKWLSLYPFAFYTVTASWAWPPVISISMGSVSLFFWIVVYRWDFLYGRELEP